jgi:cytochrome b
MQELLTMKNAAGPSATPPSTPVSTRRTVDAFTRTLHALLALSFVGAYITADSDHFQWVHVSLGYTAAGLGVTRLVWGWLGPPRARVAAMWHKLQGWRPWFKGLLTDPSPWRQGQNLFLATSVMGILLLIAPVVLSGFVTLQEWTGEWLQDVHEFLGDLMLTWVVLHVSAVLLLSLLRRRNLAAPMLTGRSEGKGPDLIKSNHAFWTILLLTAVLSFWVWQWQQPL